MTSLKAVHNGGRVSREELNVGLLLLVPYRALASRVFQALAGAGFDDFSPAQARVMQWMLRQLLRFVRTRTAACGTASPSGRRTSCGIPTWTLRATRDACAQGLGSPRPNSSSRARATVYR